MCHKLVTYNKLDSDSAGTARHCRLWKLAETDLLTVICLITTCLKSLIHCRRLLNVILSTIMKHHTKLSYIQYSTITCISCWRLNCCYASWMNWTELVRFHVASLKQTEVLITWWSSFIPKQVFRRHTHDFFGPSLKVTIAALTVFADSLMITSLSTKSRDLHKKTHAHSLISQIQCPHQAVTSILISELIEACVQE